MEGDEVEPNSAPWEDRTRPLRTAAWLLGALAVVLGAARIYIASTAGARSPKDYDRPVAQHLFALVPGDAEWVDGLRPGPEPSPVPRKLADLEGALAPLPLPEIPRPDLVDGLRVTGYTDPKGGRRFLLAVRWKGETVPAPPAGAVVAQDHHGLWLLPAGSADDPLARAVRTKAERMKRVTVQLAKVRALGNSYVTFTMEIMIGLFFALTGMILAKLYLIQANLEKT